MRYRLIPALALAAYGAFLVNLLILRIASFRIGHLMLNFSGTVTGPANLVPFKTTLPYLLGEKGWVIAIVNLAGNIALFIPIGFLVPLAYRGMTWRRSLVVAVSIPLAVEMIQAVFRIGIFDIDDVILNGLGVMIGYWTFAAFRRCGWFA